MAKLENLIGQSFERLVVMGRGANSPQGGARWVCLCTCGQEVTVQAPHLKRGLIRSCGCLRKETASATGKKALRHGHKRFGEETTEYKAWRSMRDRCLNPKHKQFKDYGGRGIEICERWLSFENFLTDMGMKPSPKLSIDRKNNAGNYEPENCRWTTYREQQRNRRSNHLVVHLGRTQTITAWAEEVGMSKVTLRWRLVQGWPIEKALHP